MARMPPAPVAESSCSEKPTTWSISSWDRMRSAPARSVESSPAPSSIMVAHSAAMSLVLFEPPCSASAAPHSSASDASPPSAPPAALTWPELCSARAAAQSSSRAWSSMSATALALLNDDFLEEHRVDLRRVDGDVDAAQQLLAQAVDAGGAVEVARPELAYEDLETILDPRQQRLDLRYELLVLDLERGAELQDLGAILVRLVRKIDSHLADVEERHGRRVLWRFAGLAPAVGEEPVAASAQGGERREADAAEDRELPQATGLDLLAVFGRSRLFGLFRLLRFLGHAAAHTLARERRRARPAAIPTLASYG